jgi:site-specific recombinase XerD
MVSNYVFDIRSRERLSRSGAGTYLDGFTDWLASRSYGTKTIRSYIFAAARFMSWAQVNGHASIATLDESSLTAYRAHLANGRSGKRAHERSNAYCGARRFMLYFRQSGFVPEVMEVLPPLETRFRMWMRQHRGVCESTLDTYGLVVRRLLDALGTEPRSYTAAQLRTFVLAQSRGFSRSKAGNVVSAVRAFVRFLVAHQECPDGLRHAIPRVARWRQSGLPRYLEPVDIERILDACDPSLPLGARDRAVLLLLARLGLRASDVAGLRLGDLDWTRGRLRVTGKSRRATWLPMPQDVGDALLHYLGTARPAVAGDGVFLIVRAPYTPVVARQVSSTAQRAIQRSGVRAPSLGAHLFRHSAATGWLRQGLTLQAIGAVLRHRDVDTTAVYAKVDTDLLRQIVVPWPEEVSSC